MQKLVLVRGLPGSGKSKIGHEVFKRRGYWLVEYDHFFKNNEARQVKYDPSKKEEALDWISEQVRRAIDAGNNVVVTGLFARRKDVREVLKHAQLPKNAITVIHAHGGKGPNAKYHPSALGLIKRTWEEVTEEKHRMLDPAQDKHFQGPRRVIAVDVKKEVEVEEVETPVKPRVHLGMFKNLTDSERARLAKA